MARLVAVDTWAFVEIFRAGARAQLVHDAFVAAEHLFTVREVVAESFTLVAARAGRSETALRWWRTLDDMPIDVYDEPLSGVRAFVERVDRRGDLSFTDYALASRAVALGAVDVATADRGFRRLGLNPLFAA